MIADARYAIRGFRRAPGFTVGAMGMLALALGASTAIFSFVDRILFRPLPYPGPERLVSVGLMVPAADTNEFLPVSSYVRMRDRQQVFAGMAAFAFTSDCDLAEGEPLRARCTRIDADFLPTFGIVPGAGRFFNAGEDNAALLTFPFWTGRFGSDRSVIGRQIRIDGQSLTVVGVLPRDFELFNVSPTDLLLPLSFTGDQRGRVVRAFARLKPGVSIPQAEAALAPFVADAMGDLLPGLGGGARLVVRSLRERQTWPVRTASWSLFAAALLVLGIACGNVGNLMLARARGRRRELAIRTALGASRGRLVRQSLVEALLLTGASAAAGCALAWALLRVFVWLAPGGLIRLKDATVDGRVLAFSAALAIVSGCVLAMVAGLSRADSEALSGGRSVAGFRGVARDGWIGVQIAASLVLLSGAGLLLRELWRLDHQPIGFDPGQTITARFVLSRGYSPQRELAFFEGLEARLARLPGAFAISSSIPPFGGVQFTPYSALDVEGRPKLPEGAGGALAWRYVTPPYFAAVGIPLRRGRTFLEADRGQSGAALVLSESLAKRLFGDEDPIGRHILQTPSGWHTVVGVAADVRNDGLERPTMPEYYAVRKHSADDVFGDGRRWLAATIVARGPIDPTAIRAAVSELDPRLPLTFQTMRERVAQATADRRFSALLLGGFAACGLVLAAMGIYALVTFLVTERTREIGIRMAIGATPGAIARQFLRSSARWTAAGVVLGAIGSAPSMRWLGSKLDVASFAVAAALLALAGLGASWAPARRAARIDPARCLRSE